MPLKNGKSIACGEDLLYNGKKRAFPYREHPFHIPEIRRKRREIGKKIPVLSVVLDKSSMDRCRARRGLFRLPILEERMVKRTLLCLLTLMLVWTCFVAYAEENTQVSHYLLLGEDGYAEEVVEDARTDTIVLVSLDTRYNRVIMTSMLRDCQITNPRGNPTKANLLYKNHGFEGIIACLERDLDVQIEGAVLVNFENVKPVIDALGGVDIEIDENEYIAIRKILLDDDPNMPDGPGLVHMTGRIALAYMRDRSSGSGDFSRTERQRKVVSQLFDKCRELSLMELVGLYNEVSSGMKMNLSAMDILDVLSKGYQLMTSGADFVEFHIPQDGTWSYGTLGYSSVLDVRWEKNRDRFHELLNTPPQSQP